MSECQKGRIHHNPHFEGADDVSAAQRRFTQERILDLPGLKGTCHPRELYAHAHTSIMSTQKVAAPAHRARGSGLGSERSQAGGRLLAELLAVAQAPSPFSTHALKATIRAIAAKNTASAAVINRCGLTGCGGEVVAVSSFAAREVSCPCATMREACSADRARFATIRREVGAGVFIVVSYANRTDWTLPPCSSIHLCGSEPRVLEHYHYGSS
jgi:hypothetical protein